MQQHPIPQNVTQYQFRLVGDMTLKQFLELALGLVLAYVFYASNLIFIFKWPLIILSILFGVGLAFFPIEDRPLDQWIINFIKAIYTPTRFIWQKTNKIPPMFHFSAHAPDVINTITKTIKAPTTAAPTSTTSDLSELESTKIGALDSLFKDLPVAPGVGVKAPAHVEEHVAKPSVAVRKLNPQSAVSGTGLQTPKTEAIHVPVAPIKTEAKPAQPSAPTVIFSAPSAPKSGAAMPTATPKHITLPASPKLPNLVTGVIVDKDEKQVENAIVQIVSSDGIPQRAMKTNSLGQFYTSTPLSPGSYVVEVDKMGLSFSPQQITINNSIMSPIELRASN